MSAWPKTSLGACCTVVSGATPKTSVAEFWNGVIRWVTPADLSELSGKWIDDTPRKLTEAGLRSCAATLLPEGSVLLSSRAPIGHVAITRAPMATNQGFKSLIPRADLIDASYLYYWLRAHRSYLQNLGNGATFKEISKAVVSKVEIPLPPLQMQRKIAEMLDRAEELRAKRRQAIALLDELAQSIFLDMFGDPVANPKNWPQESLDGLLSGIDSGRSPSCLNRPADEGEWGVLKLGAITRCVFRPNENKALPESVAPDARHEVHVGDILFSRKNTRELVAACALVEQTPPRLLLPDLIFRLNPRDDAPICGRYLHRLLIYPSKRRKVQELAGGSAGSMPNISKSTLLKLSIPLPPLQLQRKFSVRVDGIERLRTAHQAHLLELDELFSSLQQRAFRGEL
jgi:type I restriction enzyme S subunit